MAEPESDDILEYEVAVSTSEAVALVCKLGNARVSAAYWRGRHEGLEALIGEMKEAHARAISQLASGHELTLGYLKDRLNRLEVGLGVAPGEAQHGSRVDG